MRETKNTGWTTHQLNRLRAGFPAHRWNDANNEWQRAMLEINDERAVATAVTKILHEHADRYPPPIAVFVGYANAHAGYKHFDTLASPNYDPVTHAPTDGRKHTTLNSNGTITTSWKDSEGRWWITVKQPKTSQQ